MSSRLYRGTACRSGSGVRRPVGDHFFYSTGNYHSRLQEYNRRRSVTRLHRASAGVLASPRRADTTGCRSEAPPTRLSAQPLPNRPHAHTCETVRSSSSHHPAGPSGSQKTPRSHAADAPDRRPRMSCARARPNRRRPHASGQRYLVTAARGRRVSRSPHPAGQQSSGGPSHCASGAQALRLPDTAAVCSERPAWRGGILPRPNSAEGIKTPPLEALRPVPPQGGRYYRGSTSHRLAAQSLSTERGDGRANPTQSAGKS